MSEVEGALLDFANGQITRTGPEVDAGELIARERREPQLAEALQVLWLGGREAVLAAEEIRTELEASSVLSKTPAPFLSRAALYARALRVSRELVRIRRKKGWAADDWRTWMLKVLANDDSPLLVHDTVFLPALRFLASPEQLEEFLSPAQEYAILGCYAQTELGHGSNVAGLETRATYLAGSDEVELHTPSLQATKWWVGNLGRTATHAIVWARLFAPVDPGDEHPSHDCGVVPFLVRIRRETTHEPLVGVSVGDIGPKLGFAPVDNGYLRFERFRVSPKSLLGRCGSLAGRRFRPPQTHPKRAYAGMLAARTTLAAQSSVALALAATIATRYSAVRRQFRLCPAGDAGPVDGELPVLNYSLQQRRVLPQLCLAWGIRAVTTHVQQFHSRVMSDLNGVHPDRGIEALGSLHCLTAEVKALSTSLADVGMEECRKACGGHGYSTLSGISPAWCTLVHACTAEGDNNVMLLQAARYLLRPAKGEPKDSASLVERHAQLVQGAATLSADPFWASLVELPTTDSSSEPIAVLSHGESACYWEADDLYTPSLALSLLLEAVRGSVSLAESAIGHRIASSSASAEWNPLDQAIASAQPLLRDAAHLHAMAVMCCCLLDALRLETHPMTHPVTPLASWSDIPSEATRARAREVLLLLARGCLLSGLLEGSRFLLASGVATPRLPLALENAMDATMRALRSVAVVVADGFGLPDHTLSSAIGKHDSAPYSSLWRWAQHSTLDGTVADAAFRETLAPLMEEGWNAAVSTRRGSKL
jgi:acyl-CoA oxidase